MKTAGCATVSEIALHWAVCETTAREILAAAGILPASTEGWTKYRWEDIWRLEGELYVPSHAWRAYKAPLLKTAALAELDSKQRSERTMRRYIERGMIPAIRLSAGVVRVRECVFDVAIHCL